MMKTYNSVKDFVDDMIENEGVTFADDYGRRWKYNDYHFWFSDINQCDFSKGAGCLHLYNSWIVKET